MKLEEFLSEQNVIDLNKIKQKKAEKDRKNAKSSEKIVKKMIADCKFYLDGLINKEELTNVINYSLKDLNRK